MPLYIGTVDSREPLPKSKHSHFFNIFLNKNHNNRMFTNYVIRYYTLIWEALLSSSRSKTSLSQSLLVEFRNDGVLVANHRSGLCLCDLSFLTDAHSSKCSFHRRRRLRWYVYTDTKIRIDSALLIRIAEIADNFFFEFG